MSQQLQKLIDFRRNWDGWLDRLLWQAEFSQLPRWRRLLLRSGQIAAAVLRDLLQEQLSLRAMSLVFTTLIGFFPLFALTFAVLKTFGAHNALEPTLLTLLEPLGDRSIDLTARILDYVDNMRVDLIGITSVGLLIYIVLDMMRKIESAFNYIWAVKRGRSWSSRISEYLFAVIVSPFLLFLSISITTYVNTNFFQAFLENLPYGTVLISFTAWLAPILLMSLAFAFAYSFLPNTRVYFVSAFIGGFVTTLIWKLMGVVIQEFFISPARESIYLAFASAIVIMFFIYLGWMVALVGSSISFYHQNPAKTRTGRGDLHLSISQQERLNLAVAAAIIERFTHRSEPLTGAQIIDALGSNPMAIESALNALTEIGLITETGDDPPRFLPTRSVADCTLVEVWEQLRANNADTLGSSGDSNEIRRVEDFQKRLEDVIKKELGQLTFAQLHADKSVQSASEKP